MGGLPPDWIDINMAVRDGSVIVAVRDFGMGFSQDILTRLGNPYTSNKLGTGRGLGLFLVITTLKKLGGETVMRNHAQGGAEVIMSIPMERLRV